MASLLVRAVDGILGTHTPQIAEHQQRFSRLISRRVPFSDVGRAFQLVLTPSAAEKVVVTFDD